MKSIFPTPLYLGALTRSPIGKFGGSLRHLTAPALAARTLKEAIRRAGNPSVEWVILGHARQAGAGPNPARQAGISAGLADTVPAFTVNQACSSGMLAIFGALEKIALKQANSIWAGGVESMSNTPYLLPKVRWGLKMGHAAAVDGMHQDGFFCPMSQMVMGATVENYIAQEQKISRKDQDAFALESQKKAKAAWEDGRFNDETFEIPAEGKKPGLSKDEHLRPDTTIEKLGKLPPVFSKTGTLTAGNSSGITDGAAFVWVTDAKQELEVIDYATIALDPQHMGLGPIAAIQKILERQELSIDDLEAIEINEAFAAQVLACQRALKIPDDKLNQNGGSIAIGHPIGATGARITITLGSLLKNKPGALGIAALCVSGGHGAAILLRRTDT